jgi:hypothetical protein
VLQWVQRMHSNWRELVADTDNDEDEDTVLTDMLSEAGRSGNVPALQWLCTEYTVYDWPAADTIVRQQRGSTQLQWPLRTVLCALHNGWEHDWDCELLKRSVQCAGVAESNAAEIWKWLHEGRWPRCNCGGSYSAESSSEAEDAMSSSSAGSGEEED